MREKFVHIAMDDKLFIYAFLFFLITSGSFVASAKDFLIVDVYFDDGSVSHNAEYSWPGDYGLDQIVDTVRFEHENEIFTFSGRFISFQNPLFWEQGVGGSNPLAPTI